MPHSRDLKSSDSLTTEYAEMEVMREHLSELKEPDGTSGTGSTRQARARQDKQKASTVGATFGGEASVGQD